MYVKLKAEKDVNLQV